MTGARRGIALALGDAGATVYVTGRSVTEGTHALPGTVGQTAKKERAVENLKKVPGMASQLVSAAGTTVEFPGRIIAALAADQNIRGIRAGLSSMRSSRPSMA